MQNCFKKNKCYNKTNGFYLRIKLKGHFQQQTNKLKVEKDMSRKPTDKT